MVVKKLSQIDAATALPALTDTVVGVGGGTHDFQYTVAQVNNIATGNITWYVSPSGSDANDGLTTGTAFATPQHAVNVAAATNFQNLFQPTIQILDGTYTGVGLVTIPPLLSTLQLNIVLATVPSNSDPTHVTIDWFLTIQCDPAQTVSFNSCSGTFSSQFPFVVNSGVLNFNQNYLKFTDATGSFPFFLESPPEQAGPSTSQLNVLATDFDFTACTNIQCFITGGGAAVFVDHNFHFPGSPMPILGHWAEMTYPGFLRWHRPRITSGVNPTGKRLLAFGGVVFSSFNGVQADLPGDADGPVDNSLVMTGDHVGPNPLGSSQALVNVVRVPLPTNSPGGLGGDGDVITNGWTISKDTTNGQRWLAVNDGGLNPANNAVVGKVYLKQIGNFINTQTGAAYTLALTDTDGIVEMSNAGANTLTVPLNATVPFNIGDKISVVQAGAGVTTIAAAAGVTVRNVGAIAGGQWKSALLYKRGTDEWVQVNGAF